MTAGVIEDVSALIGPEAVRQIVRQWGGTNIYVRKEVAKDDPVTLTIGIEKASLLSRTYGGETIELPARPTHLSERNCALLGDIDNGQTIKDVALKYGLTIRQIFNIRRASWK